MSPFDVIVRPILSEKSNDLRDAQGQYMFEIRKDATKNDVRKAVHSLWGVKVDKVQTLVQRGKVKRRGTNFSKPGKTKKAFVTLADGAKLPLFEDQ